MTTKVGSGAGASGPAAGSVSARAAGPAAETFVDVVRRRAGERPERAVFTFLGDGEEEAGRLTFAELDRGARAVARALAARSAPGDRVLLLYPPGLELVVAFLGCLYAGRIAVPAAPPRHRRYLSRFTGILRDAEPALALSPRAVRRRSEDAVRSAWTFPFPWCVHEELDAVEEDSEGDWCPPEIGPEGAAFLQYTSGSTAAPRGVIVSHRALLHNQATIRRAFGHSADTVVVGWLPLHHDMGLIGNVLQPLFVGGRCVLMAPAAFLQRPRRWLQAVSTYRATTSGAPDFAFDLCVRRIDPEDREGLDLSSWRVAFNGAEPVRASTLDRFAEAFARQGFDRRSFYPCYGLAEATLFVTGGEAGEGAAVGRFDRQALEHHEARPHEEREEFSRLVASGRPRGGQRVEVVDPEAHELCAPGKVGEVWIAGPSVGDGYWGRPEETAATFRARLAGGDPTAFLRTGDLGFFEGGRLFITGRLKDLVILYGRNCYPQDLEAVALDSHPLLRPGAAAAFAVEAQGREQLVLVAEVERRHLPAEAGEEVLAGIRQALAEAHEVAASAVVLVPPGGVPRTTSGKVRRRACRRAYEEGTLRALASWRAPAAAPPPERRLGRVEAAEIWLRHEVSARAGGEVDPSQPLAASGLDSLAATELEHLIETRLGVRLPQAAVLEAPSLTHLAHEIERRQGVEAAPRNLETGPELGEHPLSPGQEALLYLHALRPEHTAYNLAVAVRLLRPVDSAVLRQAAAALAAAHPVLRTTYTAADGDPRQRVASARSAAGLLDFREEVLDDTRASDAVLEARLEETAWRPFDLENGPVLRVHLLRRGPAEAVLVVALHHLAGDLWSLSLLLRALLEGPAGEGLEGPGAEPSRPFYTDWVRFQRRRLAGARGAVLGRFWKQELTSGVPGGLPPELDLPTDRPRPPLAGGRAGSVRHRLGAPLTARIRQRAAAAGTTPYALLVAASQALLGRYAGQRDFLLGTLAAGREGAELAGLVGFLVQTLALRADLGGRPSFERLLARVRRRVTAALAHQDYPFPTLVEKLRPGRAAGQPPLLRALVSLQSAPLPAGEGAAALALAQTGPPFAVGEQVLEPVALPPRFAQFDLALMGAQAGDALLLDLRFDRDLFDAVTLRRLAGHLEAWLTAACEAPRRPLDTFALLHPAERHQLLLEHNDTAVPPVEVSVLEEIETAVRRHPKRLAVRFTGPGSEAAELRYGELNRRADAVARWLRGRGVGVESVVAVLLERGPELPVALLGVWKAGAAYLPLEPGEAPARTAGILADAGAEAVLVAPAGEALAGGLPVLALGPGAPVPEEGPPEEPVPRRPLPLDRLASVIYTSGSTGRPKGVMNTHRGLANRLRWMQRRFPLEPGEPVLHKTPTTFDVSAWELFWPLAVGARLVVAPPGLHRDAQGLMRLLRAERITTVHFVPSMLRPFLEDAGASGLTALRRVVTSGEALPAALVRRFYERLPPQVSLENLYGPTEASIDVTAWRCERGDSRETVPIGHPIDEIAVHVSWDGPGPAPLGVSGEILLGGVGLARGYLADPRRTASSFVPDPFGGPGERLYRTGDLGHRAADATVRYVCRGDHQVKVRGVRIEPGEVEAALVRHPAVREAVVVVWSGPGGGEPVPGGNGAASEAPAPSLRRFAVSRAARLVAYFTSTGGEAPAPGALRAFLLEHLPEPMVPAVFLPLAEIPRTASGKVDRGRLPAPGRERPELSTASVPPGSDRERSLVEVWKRVLGLDEVGVEDSFFELGGDSIRTIQVRAALEEMGLHVPLEELERRQTIRELAPVVERSTAARRTPAAGGAFSLLSAEDRAALPPGVEDAYPLTRTQALVLFHARYDPDSPLYRNVFVCRLRGPLFAPLLHQAVGEAVERHPMLRASFHLARFSEPLQLVWPAASPQVQPRLEVVEETADPGARDPLTAWIETEKRRPFDGDEPPLVRFSALRLDRVSFALALSYVDALLDGWSTASLVAELLGRYDRLLAGSYEAPAAAPAVTFRDFVALERASLREEASHRFWSRSVEGAEPSRPCRWPGRAERGVVDHSFAVETGTTAALEVLARTERVSLKPLLLAAHLRVLAAFTGRAQVTTGVEVHGRLERPGGDRCLGMHVNILPLAEQLGGESWRHLVQRLAAAEAAWQPHRRYPLFEVQKRRGGAELAAVVFNFTHFHVLGTLSELASLKPVDALAFDQTNFLLRADFARNPLTGELRLSLAGRAAELTGAQLTALADAYRRALEALAGEPAQAVTRRGLLAPAHRHQLLVEWNDSGAPAPPWRTLDDVLRHSARRYGGAVALEADGRRRTYADLDAEVEGLAAFLRTLGIAPETGREALVALYLPRGADAVVALLGVLRAGGAYLPLDPRHPAERTRFLLEDSGAGLVLTLGSLAGDLAGTAARTVSLDRERGSLRDVPAPLPPLPDRPDRLAYVLYTSGSTGAPKGVEVSHRAVLNLLAAMLRRPGLCAGDTWLAVTTLGFDISVAEIFLPLAAGARLVSAPPGTPRDAAALAAEIERSGATVLQATPATFRLLVDGGWAGRPGLRLLCGGEALSRQLADELLERSAGVWNLYGPTEATVWATAAEAAPEPGGVAIGRPLDNLRSVVVDGAGRPLPAGVPGELWIGGSGLARGYRGRPALTASRFVPDAFGAAPGARLYRSGDLARTLPSGALEVIDRLDRQVKIQGFRIEPAEVEAALLRCEGVREAAVLARETAGGHRQLVAYLVAAGESPPSRQVIASQLERSLPPYMVPSRFVSLASLPRLASGKVDRNRLAEVGSRPSGREKRQRILERVEELTEEQALAILTRRGSRRG